MNLQELITAADFKICGGGEYQWDCYGKNARFMDIGEENDSASVVFDSQTQQVYEVNLYVKDRAYRWIDPDFLDAFKEESAARGVDFNLAYDDVQFQDCLSDACMLDKVSDWIKTGDCRTDFLLPVDFTDHELAIVALAAHEKEMTLNQFINEALREQLDRMKMNMSEDESIFLASDQKVEKSSKKKKNMRV